MLISKGLVFWLTGLPAAGKTTLAESFFQRYGSEFKCKILDGDQIRKDFPTLGFSKKDRVDHVGRVAELAARHEAEGYVVLVALISPYRESRMLAKKLCRRFFEIYVSTPLQVCIDRDPKGLYKKALNHEILNFTGISDPYESPMSPDLNIDTSKESLESALLKLYALAKT